MVGPRPLEHDVPCFLDNTTLKPISTPIGHGPMGALPYVNLNGTIEEETLGDLTLFLFLYY
jgi:hypothetical protein